MTSSELYAKQKQMIEAKAEFNTNVNNFLSICSGTLSKASSIQQEFMLCNDSNIRMSASNSGCVQNLVNSITRIQNNVSSALSSANSSIQAEIDELGRQAALAAAREAAIARARTREMANNSDLVNSRLNRI